MATPKTTAIFPASNDMLPAIESPPGRLVKPLSCGSASRTERPNRRATTSRPPKCRWPDGWGKEKARQRRWPDRRNCRRRWPIVNAAVLAFGFPDVHGVKEGGMINQAQGGAQKHLRKDQNPQGRREEHGAKTNDHHRISAGQKTKSVVPFLPEPEQDKGPGACKEPDRADHARPGLTEIQAGGQGGNHRDNSIDGQIGERIGQQGHFQKGAGRNGTGAAFGGGFDFQSGVVRRGKRLEVDLFLQPK